MRNHETSIHTFDFLQSFVILAIFFSILSCDADPDDLKFETRLLPSLELSQKKNRPILLHFTSYLRSHNEFMYELVTSRKIQDLLNERYIVTQLYVDDKQQLEFLDSTRFLNLGISSGSMNKIIKNNTIGLLNSLIQRDLFHSNAQPMYVIMDSNMNLLMDPFYYAKRDQDFFEQQLMDGLELYTQE